MRARANQDERMTWRDFAALAIVAVVVLFILHELGPALDREFAVEDARVAGHQAMLVSK